MHKYPHSRRGRVINVEEITFLVHLTVIRSLNLLVSDRADETILTPVTSTPFTNKKPLPPHTPVVLGFSSPPPPALVVPDVVRRSQVQFPPEHNEQIMGYVPPLPDRKDSINFWAGRGADLVRVSVSLLFPSHRSGCVVACVCVPFDGVRSRSDLVRLGSKEMIQRLQLLKRLPVHNGCVNSLCWNETGEYILSGSDDQHLVVTNGYNYKVQTDYKTSHRANIFSAKFLPNTGDNNVISCSGDGIILYTDLMRKDETFYNQFNCHSGTTYEVITVPNDPHSFLSCGEDGTVRWFDLRVKDRCNKPQCKEDIMITCQRAVTALSVNPTAPYQLAIGCSDSTVRMFDRRMLGTKASGGSESTRALRPLCSFTVPQFEDRSYRITSLCFSPDGEDILVSYSSDHLYLFSVKDHSIVPLKASMEEMSPRLEKGKKLSQRSPPPVRRLRLRGDWSDTGPNARPEREGGRRGGEIAQARPTLHATLMQRMTDVLSRMLNDPATRAALSGTGEDTGDRQTAGNPLPEANSTQTSGVSSQEVEQQEFEEIPLNSCSTSSSISVPQLSTLSIHSGERVEDINEGVDSGTSTAVVIENSAVPLHDNALDLSQHGLACDGGSISSTNNITNIALSPSSSSSVMLSPGTEMIKRNISNLQDQLSTMREGFIERHGSEPTVSLVYSDKGSTSATISLGVGDEVSRELHPHSISPHAAIPMETEETLQAEPNSLDQPAGPSQSQSLPVQNNAEDGEDEDGEEDYNDSDDDDLMTAGTRRVSSDLENREMSGHPGQEKCKLDLITQDNAMSKFKKTSLSPLWCLNPALSWVQEAPYDKFSAICSLCSTKICLCNMGKFGSHMEEAVAASRHDKEMMFDEQGSNQPAVKQKYLGHRNARTMIKEASFWGQDYVLSGSDCGHVFAWDRHSGALVMLLEADHHVVNCLQPHPFLPILATSGIDYDVKLWAPLQDEPCFDLQQAQVLMKRNEVMLEETKDTITVPASFMIRMLACLNQIRRGGGRLNRKLSSVVSTLSVKKANSSDG
uniref:Nuclear receptor interaction protein n=1 Tax=Timema douglasi TaxID=61478 RepID=A0A7R8Z6B7_TIMDO|nr:unnamed protein product [Timema douglasi]